MRHSVSILKALDDPKLFGSALRDPKTWTAWRTFLAALFGLPLSESQLETFRACTGRANAPATPSNEAFLICGRRAGKSFTLALIAVYLAAFHDYKKHLAVGERGTVMVLAADTKQARTIFRYVKGLLSGNAMLARMIDGERAGSVDLANRVTIEVHAASFRSVRGYTVVAALCDEIAFWRTDDAADPDYEILNSIRPAMSTIPGAMLLCASSPYARRGALHDAFKRYWSKDDAPALVWRAPTRVMNPTVPQRVIDEAYERDAPAAAAEYGAEFRTDVESFLTREVVEAAISPGVIERAPLSGQTYAAFVDPSGGSSDSMTLAIAHRENNGAILDAVRERKPPFSPEAVVQEFSDLLKQYRVWTVYGDKYAGEFPRELFRKRGIQYTQASKPKSDIYLELLPAMNSRRVDLLDHQKLTNQLVSLERRTARGGKDSIDHAPGAHDDLANAVAGAIWMVLSDKALPIVCPEIVTLPRYYFEPSPDWR